MRKRLDSDIRPHLLRCAAHAEGVDAFMAAAARLLVDAREREHWLASWSPRRRHRDPEADETAAPDITAPGELDLNLNLTSASHTPGLQVKPYQLERLRKALAFEVGPVAKLLIETESQQSTSMAELLTRLQTHLEDQLQRQRFLDSVTAAE